ncbi:Spc98 family-domain-containing protein [Zopfochytrium polystomum]|nr:Spc98 family-domain-containing protein [Zopfochytrium polystomum]
MLGPFHKVHHPATEDPSPEPRSVFAAAAATDDDDTPDPLDAPPYQHPYFSRAATDGSRPRVEGGVRHPPLHGRDPGVVAGDDGAMARVGGGAVGDANGPAAAAVLGPRVRSAVQRLVERFLSASAATEEKKADVAEYCVRRVLSQRWAVLYFLLAVSGTGSLTPLPEVDAALSASGIQKVTEATVKLKPGRSEFESFGGKTEARGKAKLSSDLYYSASLFKQGLSEKVILRDMLFVFQGIDGQFVKFNKETSTYAVTADSLPSSAVECVLNMAELGFLYRRINEFQTEASRAKGLILQSFSSGIQRELNNYFNLISVLENDCEIDNDGTRAETGSGGDGTMAPKFFEKGLSLKRLSVWIMEPLLCLRFISVLIDACRDLKGGALISGVHCYAEYGDSKIQQFTDQLLCDVTVPFYNTLRKWIFEGELEDPFGEFFVVADASPSEDNIWRSQYSIQYDMVPTFMTKASAKKCFLIGKSLNFLRQSCDSEEFAVQHSSQIHEAKGLNYSDQESFDELIQTAYNDISRSVLDILFDRYSLMDHFLALKKYLLLGQGDLIQNLMEKLGTDLSKSAHLILRHNLTGVLEASIRSSNAQFEQPDIIRRLDVRLLELSDGDSGWDVFSLDYHVDSPISTVKLFTFLWRLKRIEHTLAQSWRRMATEAGQLRLHRGLQSHFHQSSVVLSQMIHFIFQLQYFILFELIAAHNKYLNKITSNGLLSSSSSGEDGNVAGQLTLLFERILAFQESQTELLDSVLGETDSRPLVLNYSNLLMGESRKPTSPAEANERLQDLGQSFRDELEDLIRTLKKHRDASLAGLGDRLDYNFFYSNAA